MPENDVFFHLPLDEIRYDPAKDSAYAANVGQLGSDAVVHGKPQIVHDPDLGSCMLFDGVDDYVELTGLDAFTFADGMTAAAWVRFDATQRYSRIFDLNEGENSYQIVRLGNQSEESTIGFAVNMFEERADGIEIAKWQHFAVSYDTDGNIALFIDGNEVAKGYRDFDKANTNWKIGYVGKSSWDRDALFKGAMAHFRLYNQALSAAEIQAIRQQDKTGMAHYRETTLLKVDLYTVRDDDHKPILYIESDNKSEPLELAVANPGNKPVAFKPFTQPTEDDFHLQFRFRRNVMAPNIRARLERGELEVEGWRNLVGTAEDGRDDYLSFVKTDGVTAEGAFELAKGATELIRLPEFSAAAQGGARNTRIEVRFRTEAQDPGSVIRHMEIQSHLGLKNVPLVARVAGSNTLLNDGQTPNDLKIEILYARLEGAVRLGANTRFELAVDRQLIKEDRLSATTTVEGLTPPPKGESADGFKTFVFRVEKDDMEISRTLSLTLDLSDWLIDPEWEIDEKPVDSSGAYNILLRFENIPGYWDGAWVLPVQLSPLVMRDGKVGIGTDAPQAKLHVRGDATIEGNVNVGGRIKDQTGFVLPVGAIIAYGGSTPPDGWLLCDGQWRNYEDEWWKNRHEELYRVLGSPSLTQVEWSDGSGKKWAFQLPDLRSRFIVGAGQGEGNDEQGNPLRDYPINSKEGAQTHTLQPNEMPRHTHSGSTQQDGAHQHTGQDFHWMDDDYDEGDRRAELLNGKGDVNTANTSKEISATGSAHSHEFTTESAGNSQAHNNLPPYYALTYIIKY